MIEHCNLYDTVCGGSHSKVPAAGTRGDFCLTQLDVYEY